MFIYILPILAIIISILFVQKYMTIKEGNQNQSTTPPSHPPGVTSPPPGVPPPPGTAPSPPPPGTAASGQQLSQRFPESQQDMNERIQRNKIAKGQRSIATKWNKLAENLHKQGDVEGEKRARMKVKQIGDNIYQAEQNGLAPPQLPSDLTYPPPGTAPPTPPPGVPSAPDTTTSTSQANSAQQQQAQSAASVEQSNLASEWIKQQIGKAPQHDPTGVQTGTTKCHIENCVKPDKVGGGCIGETDPTDRRGYNDNPIEKSDKSLYKSCNHKCLLPGTAGYKDLMPSNMADYKVEVHGCRTDTQCNACGRVAVDVPSDSGFWKYINKGAMGIKRYWEQHNLKFDDSNKATGYLQGYITKCEQERMQGTHKKSCPADLWTPEERDRKKAESLAAVKKSEEENKEEEANTVNAMSNNADTTTGNMFLDINNPSHIGQKDMSLEDYYNRRILNNNKENRLGGSKSSYTEQYKPDNKRKIQYFNSVWKLF